MEIRTNLATQILEFIFEIDYTLSFLSGFLYDLYTDIEYMGFNPLKFKWFRIYFRIRQYNNGINSTVTTS